MSESSFGTKTNPFSFNRNTSKRKGETFPSLLKCFLFILYISCFLTFQDPNYFEAMGFCLVWFLISRKIFIEIFFFFLSKLDWHKRCFIIIKGRQFGKIINLGCKLKYLKWKNDFLQEIYSNMETSFEKFRLRILEFLLELFYPKTLISLLDLSKF